MPTSPEELLAEFTSLEFNTFTLDDMAGAMSNFDFAGTHHHIYVRDITRHWVGGVNTGQHAGPLPCRPILPAAAYYLLHGKAMAPSESSSSFVTYDLPLTAYFLPLRPPPPYQSSPNCDVPLLTTHQGNPTIYIVIFTCSGLNILTLLFAHFRLHRRLIQAARDGKKARREALTP